MENIHADIRAKRDDSLVCQLYFAGYQRQHCLECNSEVSWSECDLEQNYKKYCNGYYQRCASIMKAETRRDKIKYHKKCVGRLESPCKERRTEECKVTFCDKDLCNFAITPTATLIASSFRCKQCQSNVSWDDCENNEVEIFCGAGFRKCFKSTFDIKNGKTEYSKGCTVPLACGESQYKMPNAASRTIECCGQHVCNVVERNSTSVFLMGVLLMGSVILVFFHLP